MEIDDMSFNNSEDLSEDTFSIDNEDLGEESDQNHSDPWGLDDAECEDGQDIGDCQDDPDIEAPLISFQQEDLSEDTFSIDNENLGEESDQNYSDPWGLDEAECEDGQDIGDYQDDPDIEAPLISFQQEDLCQDKYFIENLDLGLETDQNYSDRRGFDGIEWEQPPPQSQPQVSDHTWITSIKKKCVVLPRRIKASSTNILTSIHRVPHILFQQDKNAYVPQVISIGPLHYDKRGGQLQVTEEHKWRYLKEMINRKGEAWLEQCRVAVKELEQAARECYSQVIELESKSFVEMMLLDGCFIIELFRKTWFENFEKDPIFELEWLHRELVLDLVMLENQIPFFILEALFDREDISCPSLQAAALKFFRRWPFYRNILPKIERSGMSELHIHHLLHLLHANAVLSIEKCLSSEASTAIRCASKLRESGIMFRKRDYKDGADNLLDIKFDKEKGIIEIPLILVGDKTNTILRNLIAFEQCYLHCKKYIITYTYFMDCLIDNSKDVEILRQKGIIETSLGSDEDVVLLFNKIHKEVILFDDSFYLLDVCEEINHYCGTAWPKLRATLKHDYFKNPWAVIAFIAALLLLLFTITQGFFSVFPKFAYGN